MSYRRANRLVDASSLSSSARMAQIVRRPSHYRCQCSGGGSGRVEEEGTGTTGCQCSINCSCGCRWGKQCNCHHDDAPSPISTASPTDKKATSCHAMEQNGAAKTVHRDVIVPEQQIVALSGKLVDLRCYGLDRRNDGQDHFLQTQPSSEAPAAKNCARACAHLGIPVGLLNLADSLTYVLLIPAPQVADHMDRPTEVCGRLAGADIGGGRCVLVDRLRVYDSKSKKWNEIDIKTPM